MITELRVDQDQRPHGNKQDNKKFKRETRSQNEAIWKVQIIFPTANTLEIERQKERGHKEGRGGGKGKRPVGWRRFQCQLVQQSAEATAKKTLNLETCERLISRRLFRREV